MRKRILFEVTLMCGLKRDGGQDRNAYSYLIAVGPEVSDPIYRSLDYASTVARLEDKIEFEFASVKRVGECWENVQ